MPMLGHHGASIYYEEYGKGFPILAFAPAGLASVIDVWRQAMSPINPMTEYAADYRVIVMDQRNAGGKSRAPITAKDGWHSFAEDHIALLDHLKIDRCHLMGQCIGGSFIMSLLKAQPQRVAGVVNMQPIGRMGPMKADYPPRFKAWSESVKKDHPEATDQVLDTFYRNMYTAGFVYSADQAFVASCRTPSLVLAGNDEAHPYEIADTVAKLMPNAEFIPEWKSGEPLAVARGRIKQFLAKHTPA
jgi:pimeloyl-ACP methyl ester carboxylesterase